MITKEAQEISLGYEAFIESKAVIAALGDYFYGFLSIEDLKKVILDAEIDALDRAREQMQNREIDAMDARKEAMETASRFSPSPSKETPGTSFTKSEAGAANRGRVEVDGKRSRWSNGKLKRRASYD